MCFTLFLLCFTFFISCPIGMFRTSSYDRMTAEVEQLLQTFEDFRSFVETDDVDRVELQIFVATVRSPWSPMAKRCQVRELDVEIKIEKE